MGKRLSRRAIKEAFEIFAKPHGSGPVVIGRFTVTRETYQHHVSLGNVKVCLQDGDNWVICRVNVAIRNIHSTQS